MSLIKKLHAFFWMFIAYTAIILALASAASYAIYKYMNRELELRQQVTELTGQVMKLKEENEKLALANQLLKVDIRRARIDVVSQTAAENPREVETTFTFQEYEPGGKEVGPPKEFTMKGNIVFLKSLVIKFNDEFVETNDEKRGRSLVSFQGFYGEYQEPAGAFPVDAKDALPAVYRTESDRVTDSEKKLWSRFWEISNDAQLQESFGIRSAHGEAPYQLLLPGKSYVVEVRASGGLSFRPAGEK